MILVSHLKRPDGKGHEDGAQTSLSQLRGSAAIGQLSDIVIGVERDQQDPESKHFSNLRVLKNRYTGDTGLASCLEYNPETGRMAETRNAPVEFEENNNETGDNRDF
jgi:twinkle protein